MSVGQPHLSADVGPRAEQHEQADRLRELQEALQVRKARPDQLARPRLVQVPGHVCLRWLRPSLGPPEFDKAAPQHP